MPKYWTKLSLFSFSLLIALTAPAALALGECEVKVTGPQAISYNSVKINTYTSLANRFMQVMWPTYLKKGNVVNVADELFGELIALQMDKLEQVQKYNKDVFEKTVSKQDAEYAEIKKNFERIDEYILSLRQQLVNGPKFKYVEYLRFSLVFGSIHNLEAFDKLMKLREDPNAFKARYPSASDPFIQFDFSLQTYEGRFNFLAEYATLLPEDSRVLDFYGFENGFNAVLPLPSPFPTGSFAFFSTYHLPVLPFFSATEYELADYLSFISPSSNLFHDKSHLYASRSYSTIPGKTIPDFLDTSKVESLHKDLEALRVIVLAKNDKDLLKTFYYLFYWLRYERLEKIPFTLSELIEAFVQTHSNVVKGDLGAIVSIVKLFENLPAKFKPAPDRSTFANKIADVIRLAKEYQTQESKRDR